MKTHRPSLGLLLALAFALCARPASAQLTLREEGGTFIQGNLAPAGTAFAKDVLPGVAAHSIAHLNDATYGNANSWISNSANSFAGISLGATPVAVNRIAFGRDNNGLLGDRTLDLYTIQYTTEPNPTEATTAWTDIGTVDYRSGGLVVSASSLRHLFSFPEVNATGIRIVTLTEGTCIDEIELANQQPAAPTNIALSSEYVAEQGTPGATVGTFSASGPTVGDTFTFALAGGADDASFTIIGTTLSLNGSADFAAKKSYAIRVRAANAANAALALERDFTVYVTGRELSVKYNDVPIIKGATTPLDLGAELIGDTHTFIAQNDGLLPLFLYVTTSSSSHYSVSLVGGTGGGGNTGSGSGGSSNTGSGSSTGSGSGANASTTLSPGQTAFVTLQVVSFFPGENVTVNIATTYGDFGGTFTFRTQNGGAAAGDSITITTGVTVLYPLANDTDPSTTIDRVDGAGVTISADGRRIIIPAGFSGQTIHYTTSAGRTGTIALGAATPVAVPKKWSGLLRDAGGQIAGQINVAETRGTYTAALNVGHVKKSAKFVPGTPTETKLGTLSATLDSANHLQVTLGTNTGDLRPLATTTTATKYVAALQAIAPNLLGGGYCKIAAKATGVLTIVGVLPDGTTFSAGGAVADNGNVTIYAPVKATNPRGTIAGEFAFAITDYNDLAGEFAWLKPAQKKQSGLNFNGVDTVVTLNGSAIPLAPLAPNSSVDVNLSGANYATPVVLNLPIANDKAVPAEPVKSLVFKVKPSTISGSVVFPPSKKAVPFKGVYLPKGGRIWGLIKGDTAAGRIEGLAE